MNTVIKVENLSKQYRLGNVGLGSLKHDMNRWWYKVRGKEDPYLVIGEENDRAKKGTGDYVWALDEVSFEIEKGEVIGVIGKNGAGKSTLLKILSRTTTPTKGIVRMKGKVASLLEVGTGFHPDLTGRENIFLNGAILGMHIAEIKKKFDEIVDFSGVEKYIDTPVKRYSSGMYIRLAFAVSAHLEPDILVIDEVLAVGDVDFQKKCLGKMKEVSSKEGRTILFVSHSMNAIKNICQEAIYLRNGKLVAFDEAEKIVKQYLTTQFTRQYKLHFANPEEAAGNDFVKILRVEAVPQLLNPDDPVTVHTPINLEIDFINFVDDRLINLTIHFNTGNFECVFSVSTNAQYLKKGSHTAKCYIPGDFLNDDFYVVRLMYVVDQSKILFNLPEAINLEIQEDRIVTPWHGKWPGFVRPNLQFTISN